MGAPFLRFGWIIYTFALMTGVTALVFWPGGNVTVHFDFSGEPDRYGSAWEGFLLIPLLMSAFAALMELYARKKSGAEIWERSRKAITATVTATFALMAVIHLSVIGLAFGFDVTFPRVLSFSFGALLMIGGNYMPKSARNAIFGIRTSWSRSSDYAWARTHRMCGPLWIAGGVAILASGLIVPPARQLPVLIGATLTLVLFSIAYSYVAARSDPTRAQ